MRTKDFEMAYADDPKEVIMATQRSIVKLLKGIISDIKEDMQKLHGKVPPGLTWEQLEYLLDLAAKKEPEVIFQQESM